MQGDHDEATDRWFGMFRSVGVERLGEARAAHVGGARKRALKELPLSVALIGVLYGVTTWWQPSRDFVWVAGVGVSPLLGALGRLRRLSAVRPGDDVEFFEGRAPVVQAYRDRFTDTLVSGKWVTTNRVHRLTVHSVTGLLLEVDGVPVAPVFGTVVVTARVSDPLVGAPPTVGSRCLLTAVEVDELEAITSRSALQGWTIAVASGALAVLVTVCLFGGYGGLDLSAMPVVFLVTLAVVRFLQKKSAEALRARVASDVAGGLVRGIGIWRLPVLDMIWERDGLPGFRRLEGGGLAGGRRAPARPQTF